MPSIEQSLRNYTHFMFRYLLPGSLAFSILPLPRSLYMGNGSVFLLAPITPLILLTASGLVCVVWWILLLLLAVIGTSSTFIFGRSVTLSEPSNDLADTRSNTAERKKSASPGAQFFL
jgi:glycosylphosphatidylinositol deacylase